ncbi:MAG: hypothetical protein Q4F67_05700 [Propionibacteriaceae bacterium]|nr:hypothetical protein [Propionibacteriaceae bacterium]
MTENQDIPQEPQKHASTYSENIDPEPMDPVTELGDEEHHPERHESGYSKYGNVVDPTKNASE